MAHSTFLLGLDIGSSSVKASLVDSATGEVISSCFMPEEEMTIESPQPGWAEQAPEMWWEYTVMAIRKVLAGRKGNQIAAIGISYQMHGLVLLDTAGTPVRPAIIWCDSRAISTGRNLEAKLGTDWCMEHLLNTPGNFTASKLAWVRENEPENFARASLAMLPGDYIAYRLTGVAHTTLSGLSEGIMYDFRKGQPAGRMKELLRLFPEVAPSFGDQGMVEEKAARETGISAGTPVTYRAGDQPNNALSLKVSRPGQVAATAGTSGVIYAVSGDLVSDKSARINSFLHPESSGVSQTGVLLCINGTGIANRWIRELTAATGYPDMNTLAARTEAASDGLFFFPFGNGAERLLKNKIVDASFTGIAFNRHQKPELYRAVQEGIAFSFRYGLELLEEMGVQADTIRVPKANLFLSSLFCELFAALTNVRLEIYDTDGARGAALAAGVGAGIYENIESIPLSLTAAYTPDPGLRKSYKACYQQWKEKLLRQLT